MDGTNSAGRKVSLLNDHEPQPPHHLVRLNSFAPSLRSRTSSYDSSAAGSPPTPQLVRSNSSDSTSMQTPSPITPEFGFPTSESADFSQASFFPQQKELYPHLYDMPGALPYHPAHSTMHYQQQSSMDVTPSSTAQPNGRPKKNQYPCPMAKQIGCKDHFTTSGHAARHAKKHTGKKDAICPECNKAFTRKDNMEQHRRTHQSGRGATKTSDRDAKKAKLRTQVPRPKPSPIQSQATTPTMPSMSAVDPSLANSPTGSFMAAMQPSEAFVDYNQRAYPDPTAYAISAHSYMNGSSYGGLDALASAASREQQNLEDDSDDEHRHHLKRQRQS